MKIISTLFLRTLCLLLITGAAQATQPTPILSLDDARHLLTRTGFAPSEAQAQAQALVGQTRQQAVSDLLNRATTRPTTAPPAFV
jgi:hypothetical protein